MIESVLIWICLQGACLQVRPEAAAIAACESGDTKTIGTGKWYATNTNVDGSIDTGAWQFNSYWTWSSDDHWVIRPVANKLGMTANEFLKRYPTANDAPPDIQYVMFEHLWDDGKGAWHWNASRDCWKALLP